MTFASPRIAAAAAILAAAVMVSACTGPAPSSSPVAAHNADDIAFAENMISHHEQAVELSAMVPARSSNPDVVLAAGQIAADQRAEILTMQGLLAQWGEQGHGADHHGGMAMSGMVDPGTMGELRALRGTAFDDLWMSSMIGHHQGAIEMATNVLAGGESQDAKRLAEAMILAQRREVAHLSTLLDVSS